VIRALEDRLQNIEALRATGCCLPDASVVDVHSYLRQYVGINVDGKPLIYINAFKRGSEPATWRAEPVVWCDGGANFWGAVYDPARQAFSDLAFNGPI
jgi:hypothetical protein